MFKINKLVVLFVLLVSSSVFAQEKLIFSIDLIRHGDRTPDREIPASPYAWQQGLGELTTIGVNQEYQLGAALRKKYVDQYHLLPAAYDTKTLYVRSTDMNRTLMSATSFLSGLYPLTPGSALPTGFQPIPVHTVPLTEDKLLIVKPRKNIFSLCTLYFFTQRIWWEKSHLFKEKLPAWREATGMQLNNYKQIVHLADNLYIRMLHHVPLPQGTDEVDANTIISVAEESILKTFKRKEIFLPMGHKFLSTVADYMKDAIDNKTPLKYVLFSAHDSSIMAVMSALGSPLNKMPHYASDLNFSLWQDNNRYYIKVTLNDEPVVMPGCDKNVCSLEQFRTMASC